MKRILLTLTLVFFIAPIVKAQGEQRYAGGTATDQDGNTFEWINYGTQDWSIENAEVVTYRDGTEIPHVTDATEWSNLTTGAWCYYNNDQSKGKLYNWYAVMGIHDNDDNTPNKEFAPEGWRVPSDNEWTELENYLIDNGYNYDGTTTGNKIAISMAFTTEWNSSTNVGAPGYDQGINNTSGFNAVAKGVRNFEGDFILEGNNAIFRSSTEEDSQTAWNRNLLYNFSYLYRNNGFKQGGISVRFVRDLSEGDILLNGTVSAENNQIKNVADPTDAQDAVTLSLLQTKLDELIERIEVLESNTKYDCGLTYFEDFSSCDLSGFNVQGGNITSTNSSFDGCGVYMTHYAGQEPNNFYDTDKKFLYGVYELEALANNGISDNIVYILQQEELTGGYMFSLRPTGTDNPGWSVYNDGELVDSADTFPVGRGNWYNVKIEVLKSSLKVWINDVVLFETDSITPPSDIPGYFKVGVAYSGGFDNLKFTPDSSVCE